MDEIDWNDRLIAIKGGRGVGKTDFLLAYAREKSRRLPHEAPGETLYVNFNNFYFSRHSITEFASEFVKKGGTLVDFGGMPIWNAALTKDGHVLTAPFPENSSKLDTGDWENVKAISLGRGHLLGLLEDGSVLAVGDNSAGQCG
jgi:hypothetical protein